MHKIKYTRYPNNEIRAVHYYKAPPKLVNDNAASEGGDLACSDSSLSPEAGSSEATPPTLDISNDLAKRGGSSDRKKTVFGLNAKRTLLRLGGAYDTLDSNPSNFLFLTGTIPGGTHAAFSAVAEESYYIVRTIADWLRQTAPSEHWFYVWELQKRGALHIHYCIYPSSANSCEKILSMWMAKWASILDEVGRKRGCNMWLRKDGTHHREGRDVLQAYAQRVQKSVAAYLSGYCGGAKDKHTLDKDSPYYPSRWWGCSRKSTKLLRDLTETVEIEHTNYRDARYEMQVHYERVLHDSPKAYHYPHKVGIGSTVVSYHPEDKGQEIWQPLNPMLYKTTTHPSTCSTIRLYQTLIRDTILCLEASPVLVQNSFRPLLTTLRDLCFPTPIYGYSIARRDLTVIKLIPSDLNSPLCTVREWEKHRLRWVLLQDSIREIAQSLHFDVHGYVCNTGDILRLLDNHWTERYLSTTDPKGESDMGGAANGSISPQTPPSSQLELWSFSDSQVLPQ